MRPLYAIAPLALVFALLAPSSQVNPTVITWSQEMLDWVFDRDHADAGTSPQPTEAPADHAGPGPISTAAGAPPA